MWWSIITVLVLGSLGLCQEQPMASCMSSSTSTVPSCTLEYTPFMPAQIPPTTTYYKDVMTTYFNIIDCRYCTVTIPDSTVSPTTQGYFTAKTTSPMLTITRVGCMPETTAITRRDIRGYPELNDIQPRTIAALEPAVHDIQPRALESQFTESDLQNVATAIAMHIDPDNTQLGYKIYLDLRSLNTALFAIQLSQSGLNLSDACRQFRDPATQLQAQNAALDPKQAGDIICWADMYGLNFGISTTDLLNKIEAAIYALQVGQNFTTNLDQLCNYLDLSFAGYLGINSTDIMNDACRSVDGTTTTMPSTQTSATFILSTGLGTADTAGSSGFAPTGEPGPWTNSSTWAGTAGTVGTGGVFPTGETGPWSNSSGSGTTATLNGVTGTVSSGVLPGATEGPDSGNGTSGSPGNDTGAGSAGNGTGPGSSGSSTGTGADGKATETWWGWGSNATATGWGGNGTASGVGGTTTRLPWATGQTNGTGWISNSTSPLPTGTGDSYGTSWSGNDSWSSYLTGGYGTEADTWTSESSSLTDLSTPQNIAVTPTVAAYYPTFETSTTAAKKVRRH